ncbi:MAG: tRNA (adenosine(37)-N6)-threonylcarbamoyltransferase complex dimerization subunit type 1 TsaB [Sphingobacteriaceae bacterium]|nr:tRNA (adenosine(37)-N6)-threonylcarbamoyltransferase complex dimerization subunit type 1 TsaB [Sphingobacteriaceae bacterium]
MINILQIETSTSVCSVAISSNGKTIAIKEEDAKNIHASSLTLFIESLMKQVNLEFNQLSAIAISKGPGSYTGLRIGVSTAKGLSFALDKPLISVPTLQMMANGFLISNPDYKGFVCPMIDARRMEVFTAVYDANLNEISATSAQIIDEQSFQTILSQSKVSFIGDGAMKCTSVLAHENSVFEADNFNSAGFMSELAYQKYTAAEFEDVAYFEPFYLKDFVFTVSKKKTL